MTRYTIPYRAAPPWAVPLLAGPYSAPLHESGWQSSPAAVEVAADAMLSAVPQDLAAEAALLVLARLGAWLLAGRPGEARTLLIPRADTWRMTHVDPSDEKSCSEWDHGRKGSEPPMIIGLAQDHRPVVLDRLPTMAPCRVQR